MQNLYIFNMTLFDASFYFFYWSVFGWILEVIVRTLETGAFEDRGFLNGPMCPIYGVGVLIVYWLLSPVKSLIVLYIVSALICTIVELSAGLIMQKLFHAKWWDYSHEKFNFKGFICLKISLLWGVGCVMVIRVVQPVIEKAVDYIPSTAGNIILAVFYAVMIMDLICSVLEVLKLNNRLSQIEKLSEKLYNGSVIIGENISGEVLELKQRYDNLLDQAKGSRIVKAFPHMKSTYYDNALKLIKEKLNKK